MFYVYMIPLGLAVNLLVDIAVRASFLITFRIWNNTDGWRRPAPYWSSRRVPQGT